MNIEEVVVTIAADGSTQVNTMGFTGMACVDATRELERLLGNEVLDRTLTDEAFQQADNPTQQGISDSWG